MGYAVEWMPTAAALGLVAILCAPLLGLLVALVILGLAAATAIVLVGAVAAAPYVLGRSLYRRQARGAAGRSRRPAAYRFGAIILRPQASHVSASQLATMKLDGPLGSIVDERGRGHPAIGDR